VAYPSLVKYDLAVNYVASGPSYDGLLTVTGTFDPGPSGAWTSLQSFPADGTAATHASYLGSFSLITAINKTTKTAVGGSLEVRSDTDDSGALDLLRASSTELAAFGSGGDGLFDFWFKYGYGDLISPEGNLCVILDAMAAGLGEPSFATDFSNTGIGLATVGYYVHPGDANGSGSVDIGDLGILGTNYGQSGKTWQEGDFTGNGTVNIADISILSNHYGWRAVPGGGAPGVPEPATLALLGAGIALLLKRRARQG